MPSECQVKIKGEQELSGMCVYSRARMSSGGVLHLEGGGARTAGMRVEKTETTRHYYGFFYFRPCCASAATFKVNSYQMALVNE